MTKNHSLKGKVYPQVNSRQFNVLEDISAGDLFVGFLSSAMSTKLMYRNAHHRAVERYRNKIAIEKLAKYGYIRRSKKDASYSFFITSEGRKALRELYTEITKGRQSVKKWDKKWRIVSYDFPEKERSARNSLRYILTKSNFLQIQKSVWVSPFDSTSLANILNKDEIVKSHTIFMTVEKISPEEPYKKHFKLA